MIPTTRISTGFFIAAPILALLLKLRLSSLGLSPISYHLPDLPTVQTDKIVAPTKPDGAQNLYEKIGENDLVYPESLVLSPDGKFLFASLGDGRIVRITADDTNWENLSWTTLIRTGAVPSEGVCGSGGPADTVFLEPTCGRPLGLQVVKRSTVDPKFGFFEDSSDDDVLLIVDSYKGLLMVSDIYGSKPQLDTLAIRADTDPPNYSFSLLNALVQAPNGDIYFTETSQNFQRRRIFHAAMDGRSTGRLLRYRRGKGKGSVGVMSDNLLMANGITLSHDSKSLVIVCAVTLYRFDLLTEKLDPKPFVEVMPGTGDNILTMQHLPTGEKKNCYWAALGGKYAQPFSLLKALSEKPLIRSFLLAVVPYHKVIDLIPKWTALAVYDEDGMLLEMIRDDGSEIDQEGNKLGVSVPWVSEMKDVGDYLFIASWYNPFLARFKREYVRR